MLRRLAVVLALAVILLPPAAGAVDPAEYEEAIETIRCDCGCHPQSLKDCACGYAAQKRQEIHAEMSAGDMSADDLIAAYVKRMGEQILISPAATGFNLVAWLGPLAGLVLASVGLLWVLRRWRRQRPLVPAVAAEVVVEPDDPYLKRLNKELEELD